LVKFLVSNSKDVVNWSLTHSCITLLCCELNFWWHIWSSVFRITWFKPFILLIWNIWLVTWLASVGFYWV